MSIFTASGVVVPAGCCGQNKGIILLTISGGNPPYTQQWSNGSTNQDQSNLSAGQYWVTITDSSGDKISRAFLVPASYLSLDFQIQFPVSGNGTLTAVPIGGQSPLTYLWSTGETTASIDVPAGVYTCTVTDSYGCEAIDEVHLLSTDDIDLNHIRCCAATLAYRYVLERESGQWECAKRTIAKVKFLKGCLETICDSCLEDTSKLLHEAKQICGCCKTTTYIPN